MIQRIIADQIKDRFFKGKAIIILGPRQSGKTTLVNAILTDFPGTFIRFNGDEPDIREILSTATSPALKSLIGKNRIVFIDEAQRIPEVGLCIKLLVDNFPELQVIATGSSALDLSGKIREPLTGRKYEFTLYPISYQEMVMHHSKLKENRLLEHRLVYGYYPEVITKPDEQRELLSLLADSYLYKDLFLLEQIKKPPVLEKIVRALAFQVGNEVSNNEIAGLVNADRQTVEKYINLLEKAFIIHRLPSLKRNLRNEIKRGTKVYFQDNGILNSVIGNFNPLNSRTDIGTLWENFAISERRKYLANNRINANCYFWRTTQQSEIDYIEEKDAAFSAFEVKWNPKKKAQFSKSFLQSYPLAESRIINPKSFPEWVS
jgi:predicted AAA+ superfamily ATPase